MPRCLCRTWKAPFRDLVAAVTHALEDSAYVWIDIFAVLQLNAEDGISPQQIAEKDADLDFKAVVKATKGLLLVASPIPELEHEGSLTHDDYLAGRIPEIAKQMCVFFRGCRIMMGLRPGVTPQAGQIA